MGFFNRTKHTNRASHSSEETSVATERKHVPVPTETFESRPTFLRLFTSFIYLAAVVFSVLVQIGCINTQSVIRDIYFFKVDLSNIVPATVPNAQLLNSLAQSIGLHDFYQVGLWGFCSGYNGQGVTYCSPPQALYWFNPVEILLNELLAGASIVLPGELLDVLDIVKTASHWMFACFLVGICLSFVCIFIAPMGYSKKPRWLHRGRRIFLRQLPVTIITFLALLFTAAGAVIATVMFIIFRNVLADQASELNIDGTLGVYMLAFEWTAVGLLLLGFIMQIGTCCGVCCCTGKRKAMKKYPAMETSVHEK